MENRLRGLLPDKAQEYLMHVKGYEYINNKEGDHHK